MGSVTETSSGTALPVTARAVGWLAGVAAVGTALLAIAHTGAEVPLLSALGPEGNDAVPPAVVAFVVATAGYATIAVGVLRARPWSWALATVVNSLAVVSGVMQFRGAVSAVGLIIAVLSLALLLTPTVRGALLVRR